MKDGCSAPVPNLSLASPPLGMHNEVKRFGKIAAEDGIELAYIEEGEGQPVIFVHGGPNDYRVWTNQMKPFSHGYRAVAYSRRCSFPNKYTGDYMDDTIVNNAADLADVIQKLGAVPAHVVGHSYGGFIAIYCALRNPKLFRTLVLGEPAMIIPLLLRDPRNPLSVLSAFIRNPSTMRKMVRMANVAIKPAEEAFKRGDSNYAVRVFIDGVMGREDAFDTLPPPMRQIIEDNKESLRGELTSGVISAKFTKKDARRITIPTLLVKGTRSPNPLREVVDILAKELPNNELATINTSHGLQLEDPSAFNQVVLDFLARHG